MDQYISENMPHAEVLRMYGDQMPEFMRAWLERIVEQAEDSAQLWEVIYRADIEADTCEEFEAALTAQQERLAAYAELLDRAADKLQEYCAEVNGGTPDALGMEIEEVLKP